MMRRPWLRSMVLSCRVTTGAGGARRSPEESQEAKDTTGCYSSGGGEAWDNYSGLRWVVGDVPLMLSASSKVCRWYMNQGAGYGAVSSLGDDGVWLYSLCVILDYVNSHALLASPWLMTDFLEHWPFASKKCCGFCWSCYYSCCCLLCCYIHLRCCYCCYFFCLAVVCVCGDLVYINRWLALTSGKGRATKYYENCK